MTVSSTPPDVKLPGRLNNPIGVINDPILEILSRQIEEARANPQKALEQIDLHTTSKYTFRSKINTFRGVRIRIPGLPESERNKEEVGNRKNYGAEFERIYKKKYTMEQLEKYADLQERVGSLYIDFTPIPQRHECFYETNDELVADFIREYIVTHPGCNLYEDRGVQYIRSRYTDATFPDTEKGKQDLYAHDLTYEREIKKMAQTAESPAPNPAGNVVNPVVIEDAVTEAETRLMEKMQALASIEAEIAKREQALATTPIAEAVTPVETEEPQAPAKPATKK